jgi:5-methyltetrahydropteroyltriglutamate--homocysteine methyltransferase
VAEILFNEFKLDGFFLEYDSPRAGSFSPLRFVPKEKKIVLGLVTTKTGEMETPDLIKRRIDEAAQYIPLEQLALSPQCGFSSTVLGNNISVEAEVAKLSLVVKVADAVWG